MKKLALLLVALLLVGTTVLTAADKKEDPLKDIKCVVSGKAINPEASVEYKEGKVYFCCPGCPGAFEKGKEKFASKANHQLVATHQYHQVKCPLTGKASKEGVKVDVHGVDVGLCCKGCEKAATAAADDKEEKEKLVNLLFNDKSFEKGFEVVKETSK
ncbi:MAG: hypothetical protein O3C60_00445 [Planctomycetota bacterium]|nr:hypothetical protein [Planctomycetota bacterium]